MWRNKYKKKVFFFLLSSMEAIGFDRIRLTSIRCSFFFFALFLCVSSAIRRNWSYARCYACGYIKYYFLLHPWLLPPFSFIFFLHLLIFFFFSFFLIVPRFFHIFQTWFERWAPYKYHSVCIPCWMSFGILSVFFTTSAISEVICYWFSWCF